MTNYNCNEKIAYTPFGEYYKEFLSDIYIVYIK